METDSYGETSQALCTDNVNQFYLGTIYRQMWMLSTIPIVGFGQGSTGFFTNGAGYVTDDSVGTAVNTVFPVGNVTTTGLSRYFSGGAGAGFSSRRGWMTDANTAIQGIGKPAFQNYVGEFFGGPLGTRPLALGVLGGTWNDRSLLTNITDARCTRASPKTGTGCIASIRTAKLSTSGRAVRRWSVQQQHGRGQCRCAA